MMTLKQFFGIRIKSIQRIILLSVLCMTFQSLTAQVTQTIRGTIRDDVSQVTLPGANVILAGTDPVKGAVTDVDGSFRIENVPVGRYNIQITFIGYEPTMLSSVQLSSGKELVLDIKLKESVTDIEEVVVKGHREKEKPLNTMAMISARTFSVEDANKYAGGLDDPGRLASAFAGVSTGLMENNGIVIRGNSPKGVLWRLEGVDIPNPNHFGDAQILGGGFVTALSSQVLGNSDFLTGAFPAEYGNALAGVFDMNMRTGNNETREHTFQAGMLGIDFASEGPFVKGGKSSYLFNYRYSTFSLVQPLMPDEEHLPDYQDLSFKFNFPTKKAGNFSLWGFGGIDYIKQTAQTDSAEWEWNHDREEFNTDLTFGAVGLSHNYIFGTKTYLKTSVVASKSSTDYKSKRLDDELNFYDKAFADNKKTKYTVSTKLNHKFNSRISIRSGLIYNVLNYELATGFAEDDTHILRNISSEKGDSYHAQAFSQVQVNLSRNFEFNAGLHGQYFDLTGKTSVEPRAGLRYTLPSNASISIGYGLHSQREILRFYMVEKETKNGMIQPNKSLDFAKAHHFVMAVDFKINDNTRVKIEPYYQHLFNVPVVADSSFSMINLEDSHDFDETLVNEGYGRNYGIDFTLERFLKNGFYYLFTGSVFQSEYKGGDGKWRNTIFNRNFVANFLGGKEWQLGKDRNNVLGINGRLYLMGGRRYTPLNESASIAIQDKVYNYKKSFNERYPFSYRFDFTISYRKNKEKYSSVWSLQMLNALGSKDYKGYEYNYKSNTIEEDHSMTILPVLSYRIEF